MERINNRRAQQFVPFAALTGYSDEVSEAGRLTSNKITMIDDIKDCIDMKLQLINEHIKEKPLVTVLYFEKDKKKNGGKYLEYTGNLKSIDLVEKVLIFTDKFKNLQNFT